MKTASLLIKYIGLALILTSAVFTQAQAQVSEDRREQRERLMQALWQKAYDQRQTIADFHGCDNNGTFEQVQGVTFGSPPSRYQLDVIREWWVAHAPREKYRARIFILKKFDANGNLLSRLRFGVEKVEPHAGDTNSTKAGVTILEVGTFSSMLWEFDFRTGEEKPAPTASRRYINAVSGTCLYSHLMYSWLGANTNYCGKLIPQEFYPVGASGESASEALIAAILDYADRTLNDAAKAHGLPGRIGGVPTLSRNDLETYSALSFQVWNSLLKR